MPKFLSDGFFDGSSTDLIVDGKVGIGTSSSLTYPFYIKSSESVATVGKFESAVANAYIQISSTGQSDADSGYIGHNSSRVMSFLGETFTIVNSTTGEKIRIDSSGNMGINTTNPSQKLHVSGNARITGTIYDSNNSPGTSGQVLSSTVTGIDWIDQGDVIAGEADKAKSVVLRVKNSTASPMSKGQVICEAVSASPPNGNLIEVALADNNGTNTMPALGILNEDLDAAGGANDEGDAIMFGKVSGIDTSAFSVGDEVFVDDTPGGLTTTKPTGVKYIQKVGVVIRDDASNGTIEVFGAGRVNDVPTPLYIDHANQRLGIGITNPQTKLHIGQQIGSSAGTEEFRLESRASSGFGGTSVINLYTGTYGGAGVYFGDNATYSFQPGKIEFLDVASSLSYDSPQKHYWKIGGATKMTLNNSNVGIGTTSPTSQLSNTNVNSTDQAGIGHSSTAVAWRSNNQGYTATFDNYLDSTISNGLLVKTANTGTASYISKFESGGINRMAIRSDGNIGIGTTSPGHELVVQGTSSPNIELKNSNYSDGGFVLNRTNYTQQWKWWAQSNQMYFGFATDESTYSNKMTIQSGGNVGIGTTSPTEKLAVSGGNIEIADGNTAGRKIGFDVSDSISFNSTTIAQYGMSNAGNAEAGGITYSGFFGQRFFTNGVQRMVIGRLGNVGIGDTDPDAKLTVFRTSTSFATALSTAESRAGLSVKSTSTYDAKLTVSTGTSGIQQVQGVNNAATTGIDIAINPYGGNVGIGTTSPTQKLDVSGNARVSGILYTNAGVTSSVGISGKAIANGWASRYDSNNANYSGFYFDGNNQSIILGRNSGGTIVNYIHANASSYFNGGNVGIGTTSPQSKLHVANGTLRTWTPSAGTTAIFESTQNSRSFITITGANESELWFGNGTTQTKGRVRYENNNNMMEFWTNATPRMYINSSGNVGINTSTPNTYKLDVSGTIRATGDVIAYSDIRVKENIKTIDNALNKVKALRGVEYNKIDNTEKSIGVIAQEIEEVIPQVVKEDDQGMKSVAYGNITAVLIEAIKEQQKQIDELKNQLDAFTK